MFDIDISLEVEQDLGNYFGVYFIEFWNEKMGKIPKSY